MVQNLIPYPYYYNLFDYQGITVTDNGSGELTFNGTATGDYFAQLVYYNLLPDFSVGDTLILKGCPKGGSEDTFYITLWDNSGESFNDTGDGLIFTAQENFTVNMIELGIVIKQGTTMNNVVFKPYLGKLSIADKLTTLAENEQKVYEAGQKSEYDRFWDNIQEYGNRQRYDYAFSATALNWTDESYNPKYPIYCGSSHTNTAVQLFYGAKITDTKVPIIIEGTRFDNAFGMCQQLQRIPSLTLIDIQRITNPFQACYALEELNVYGEIPFSVSFSYSSNLSVKSIKSIVGCLKEGVTGQTVTFNATAWGRLTTAEQTVLSAECTSNGWELVV